MSIAKRKTPNGGLTEDYYYDFTVRGKRYRGVCNGCTNKLEASNFERRLRETIKRASEQKTVSALVENFRQELSGGQKVTLENAFALFLNKPRKRQASAKQVKHHENNWKDFLAFMREKHPDIQCLDEVRRAHAEEYIRYLRENGRFIRIVTFERGPAERRRFSYYHSATKISGRTVNVYHKTMKSVFNKLKEDAGIMYNPFDFEMMNNESENRDAFSLEELKLINDNLDPFLRPLFVIGICTGLSKGDICQLRWDEIKDGKWIFRRRNKTGVPLEIPIMHPLEAFLREQRAALDAGKDKDSVYVLPEHARMYQQNPSGLSYRVKQFLEGLGIKTTRKVSSHGRAVSIKDIHSLRHTFAYLAGCNGVPLSVVQSILGHMSPEMTKHYQAHADRETKIKFLSQLPAFIGYMEKTGEPGSESGEGESCLPDHVFDLRTRLVRIIQNLPEDALVKVETFLMSLVPPQVTDKTTV